ncbi:NHLP bacteriocin system secretion protein [Longimicrobium sp.]|uniref:NHLP bacteriocin system secretion protein n=1 Tax=Longimicrobium sp. TaxID=2029185 RepID=UPI002E327368|nr:NHLP bacteriocin system secretion protein [Longimicrobium sp.]HEX6041344.1 NHLP bacteriocin system secretion protein [Longimicrobium sp.]
MPTEIGSPPQAATPAAAPAPKKEIFRSVALERLSSPEQLDQLMQVTTARGWLLLIGVAALLGTALTWGILGSVPERIGGQGILIRSGGVLEVEAPGDGRVTDVAVRVGDNVTEGQVVARIQRQDLVLRIQQARAKVNEARTQSQQQQAFGARDVELQAAYRAQRRAQLQATIDAGTSTLRALNDRVQSEEQLVQQGLITRQALLNTVQQRDQQEERVRQSRAELVQLDAEAAQTANNNRQAVLESQTRLTEAERELAQLENELRTTSEVTSPYTGRVLELIVEQGSMVNRGQPILTVDLTGRAVKGLEAILYIPSVHGKKIRPGMEVQIAPSTVKKEEFGYLLGRVTYVSDFPVTPQGMQRVLKNEQLVTALSGDDAPYEIHADLVPESRNVSGLRWTSSSGPPILIKSGTMATAGVVVERRRPVEMVIPQLRRQEAAGGGPVRQ